MGPVPFNAGSIQATLELDRTPFQQGLDEAKAEADRFNQQRYSAKLEADGTAAKTTITDIRADAERLATTASSIKIDANGTPAKTEIAAVKADADRLATTASTVRLDADATPATAKVATVQAAVDGLTRDPKQMKLDADIGTLQAKIAQAKQAVDDLNTKKASPKIDADIAAAELKIRLIQGNLDYLTANEKGRSQIVIDVETDQANARMAAAKARLEELQSTRPRIDLDISSAEAKVTALEAQLATLQAGTDAAGGAADGAGAKFNAMFAAVTAGFPPASTAVLSLSGALALVVAPMAAISIGMTGIQAAAAPLAGQFLNLQSIVSATFEQGMKPAITDVSAVLPTLSSGLVGTASALSTVAQQVGAVAASRNGLADLQATFSNVESIISGMAPGIAGLTQNFLDLAALGSSSLGGLSTIINGLSTQWHDLITNLSSTGVAQGAMSSLTQALGAILAILPPLVSQGVQLMDVLGPPLVGALQLVGGALNFLTGPLGGLTSTVLAALAAWKLLSMAVNLSIWETLAAKIGLTTAAQGASTAATVTSTAATEASTVALGEEAVASTAAAAGMTRVTGAAAMAAASQGRLAVASEGATASTAAGAAGAGRFAGAMSTLGSAILPVGVALVAGYVAVKAFTTSIDDAASALAKGGTAATNMNATLKTQDELWKGNSGLPQWTQDLNSWITTNIFGVATTDSATAALAKQRAEMTPLQRAQADATVAQGNYNAAVDQFGPKSQQASEAQQNYATTTLAVTQAQAAAVISSTNLDASYQAAAAHAGEAAQAADGAAQATVSYANALNSLADPMASAGDKTKAFAADVQGASDAPRNLLEAMNAADKSVTSFASSTIKITPAMIDATGAINTTTKAGQELATGILGTAKAFDNVRGAAIASSQAAGDDTVTQLAKGDAAMATMRQNLIDTAVQHGATRDAAQKMVDTYMAIPTSVKIEVTQPGMVAALANTLGLGKSIVDVPNDKSVVIKSISDDARKKLEDLGLTVTNIPGTKDVLVNVAGNPAQLNTDVANARAKILGLPPIPVPIGGNPDLLNSTVNSAVGNIDGKNANLHLGADPAQLNSTVNSAVGDIDTKKPNLHLGADPANLHSTVNSAVADISGTTASMHLAAEPASLNSTVNSAVGRIDGTNASLHLGAEPAQLNSTVNSAVGRIDGTTATAHLAAEPGGANNTLNSWRAAGNGTTVTAHVNADASAAYGTINGIPRNIYITAHITASSNVNSAGGLAAGGILHPMADGGIIANANGNDLTPMAGGIAQTVAPNTWRIIGDNLRVPESYIPHDGSARSRSILAQTATDMGFGLVPKGLMEALKAAGVSGGDGASAGVPLSNGPSPSGQSGSPDVVAELRALRAELAAIKGRGGAEITNNYYTEAATAQADATVRAQRRQAALGLFG